MTYLHDKLMGAGHKRQPVGMVEGFRDVLAEGVASATGRDAPSATVIRVRPQQVTHGTLRQGERREGQRDGAFSLAFKNQSIEKGSCGAHMSNTNK